MNRSINCEFQFHKVGQGLFYTGEIGEFNFAYDCGSETKRYLVDAIDSYKDKFHEEGMDMLILSHFHYDHVSGLDFLLKDIGVTDVVIPYLAPIERLIVALRKIDPPKWYADWYYYFLRDPVSFFLNRGARRVVIIGDGKGRERPEERPEKEPKEPPEERPKKSKIPPPEEKIDIHEMPDDEKLKEIITVYEPRWEEFMNQNRLTIKNHDGSLTAPNWIFRFFDYKPEEKKLSEFKNCLKNKKAHPKSPASLRNAIINTKTRKMLKDCYNSLHKDLNYTSLVVYHGPISEYESDFTVCGEYGIFFNEPQEFDPSIESESLSLIPENQIGQFLTGDINLNYDYNQLQVHYKKFFNEVSISLVPHHGSHNSWNEDILDDLRNCSYWVVSSSISNQYGHPNFKVVHDILGRKHCFCWCNQEREFIMKGRVIY